MEQLALQKAYLGHSWLCYSRSRRFPGLYVGSARWSPGSFPCEVAAGCLVSSQLVKACLEWALLLSFTFRPPNWVVSLLTAVPLLTLPGWLPALSDVLCWVVWHFGHSVLLTSVVLDSSLFPPSLLPPTLWHSSGSSLASFVSCLAPDNWCNFPRFLFGSGLHSLPICQLLVLRNHPTPIHCQPSLRWELRSLNHR